MNSALSGVNIPLPVAEPARLSKHGGEVGKNFCLGSRTDPESGALLVCNFPDAVAAAISEKFPCFEEETLTDSEPDS